jgi:hypothetical protein
MSRKKGHFWTFIFFYKKNNVWETIFRDFRVNFRNAPINDLNDKIIDTQKLKLYMVVVRNSGNIEKKILKNNLNNFKEIFNFINDYTNFIKTFLEKKQYIIDESKILEDNINYLKSVLNKFIETFVTNNNKCSTSKFET